MPKFRLTTYTNVRCRVEAEIVAATAEEAKQVAFGGDGDFKIIEPDDIEFEGDDFDVEQLPPEPWQPFVT